MYAGSYQKHIVLAVTLIMAGSVKAGDDQSIDRAVQKGVANLRTLQAPDGTWTYQAHAMGPTALVGLTMLECGVPKDDPAIRRALDYVREAATGGESAPGANQTYDISLAILFLDRLGSTRDDQVIESLTVRLLGGQNAQGGWSYICPTINPDETKRLRDSLLHTSDQPRDAKKRTSMEALPKEIKAQIRQIEIAQPEGSPGGLGDNSNTQFATLGLWVGRRHGLPVEKALARIEKRYRATQNPDGGWGYVVGLGNTSKDTMICAGLLGLAAAYGYALEKETGLTEKERKKLPKQPNDVTHDRAVRAGLIALGTVIGPPIEPLADGQVNPGNLLNLNPAQRAILQNATIQPVNYYLMWSIERVAMAFDLQKIGNKDWYRWGSTLLLMQQQPDGGWHGQYPEGGIDTCFALLFLRRSNLAQDLTASLRGRVHDPGEARLRASDAATAASKPATAKPAPGSNLKIPDLLDSFESNEPSPVAMLSQELIKATPQNEAAVLAKLRDSKGVAYTDALATAIPDLNGPLKTKARDALAARLTRMSQITLREKFKDSSAEIRRAAILAAAMNDDKTFIPDILNLLKDPSATVWHAVPVALRSLTGKEFELATNSSPTEREQAKGRWEAWWRMKNTK
jgi:hypothetical protein